MRNLCMVYARTLEALRETGAELRQQGFDANLRDINRTQSNEVEMCHNAVFVDPFPELEEEYSHAEFVDDTKRIIRPKVVRLYENEKVGKEADIEEEVSTRTMQRGRARTVKQADQYKKPPKLERPDETGKKDED